MAESDVVALLLQQHAEIEDLFQQVLTSEGRQKQERFEELARLLAVHETAEEEVVHPMSRSVVAAGDEVVDARLEEERQAKELLADLIERGTDDPEFPQRFSQLREAVLTHAKREERYEFPYLQDRTEAGTRERLARAVRAAQRFAPTRPHPGVESAPANLLAGPPLAVLDRVRDTVRDVMRDRGDGGQHGRN